MGICDKCKKKPVWSHDFGPVEFVNRNSYYKTEKKVEPELMTYCKADWYTDNVKTQCEDRIEWGGGQYCSGCSYKLQLCEICAESL